MENPGNLEARHTNHPIENLIRGKIPLQGVLFFRKWRMTVHASCCPFYR